VAVTRKRRRGPSITIRPGALFASHIRNRAKRLGITITAMMTLAILNATDEQLTRVWP
jgi:hypothetical protein